MTTPRDDIAGLSERLRRLARITRRAIETSKLVFPWTTDSKTLDEAATQLDSLLKERDALQARVKELERIAVGECRSANERLVELEIWQARATRLQQERDEAYEQIKSLARVYWKGADVDRKAVCQAVLGVIAETNRRLAAGPEKEKE